MLVRQEDTRTQEHKTAVVLRLLSMVRKTGTAGAGVWWSGGMPRVRHTAYGQPETLTWRQAEDLTGLAWEPPAEPVRRKTMARAGHLRRVELASGF